MTRHRKRTKYSLHYAAIRIRNVLYCLTKYVTVLDIPKSADRQILCISETHTFEFDALKSLKCLVRIGYPTGACDCSGCLWNTSTNHVFLRFAKNSKIAHIPKTIFRSFFHFVVFSGIVTRFGFNPWPAQVARNVTLCFVRVSWSRIQLCGFMNAVQLWEGRTHILIPEYNASWPENMMDRRSRSCLVVQYFFFVNFIAVLGTVYLMTFASDW